MANHHRETYEDTSNTHQHDHQDHPANNPTPSAGPGGSNLPTESVRGSKRPQNVHVDGKSKNCHRCASRGKDLKHPCDYNYGAVVPCRGCRGQLNTKGTPAACHSQGNTRGLPGTSPSRDIRDVQLNGEGHGRDHARGQGSHGGVNTDNHVGSYYPATQLVSAGTLQDHLASTVQALQAQNQELMRQMHMSSLRETQLLQDTRVERDTGIRREAALQQHIAQLSLLLEHAHPHPRRKDSGIPLPISDDQYAHAHTPRPLHQQTEMQFQNNERTRPPDSIAANGFPSSAFPPSDNMYASSGPCGNLVENQRITINSIENNAKFPSAQYGPPYQAYDQPVQWNAAAANHIGGYERPPEGRIEPRGNENEGRASNHLSTDMAATANNRVRDSERPNVRAGLVACSDYGEPVAEHGSLSPMRKFNFPGHQPVGILFQTRSQPGGNDEDRGSPHPPHPPHPPHQPPSPSGHRYGEQRAGVRFNSKRKPKRV